MSNPVLDEMRKEIEALRQAGTYKDFPVIDGPMGPSVTMAGGKEVVNLCSNNYLGLANHPKVNEGAKKALERYGNGTASVRFICGTLSIHVELEELIAQFCGTEKSTTYVSCWNANEALVPTLLGENDIVISDALNHASIIDACRLRSKAVARAVYKHNDMDDLDRVLAENSGCRRKLIITDGVFSMEGDIANLAGIVELAKKYEALVAVDDSHGHGVVGKTGRGVAEHYGVDVDILTGTLGKALGGAAGGFIAGPAPVVDMMTQRSRPQLFSNALPPAVAGGAIEAFKLLMNEPERVTTLQNNAAHLRNSLRDMGYEVLDSPTAIVPVIVGETAKAISLAKKMFGLGVLITGFGFPVVPEGVARLRAQVSAAHTKEHLDKAIAAFETLKEEALA